MTSLRRALVVLALVAGTALAAAAPGVKSGHSPDTLAVRGPGGWETWWRRDAAPVRWNGDAPLAARVAWRPGASGMEWGELQLRGASEAWRTRVVLVRLDPRRLDLSLVAAFTRNEGWTVSDADSGAVLALDAGQFRHSLPWGWVVSKGREVLAPEYAPLAGAVVVDSSAAVRIVAPDSVAAERARGTAREAFQSYPMLLQDGVIPVPLREAGLGVDLSHRDARLALGTLADGRVVVALTRFDTFGESLGRVPFGLTSSEMAAVMGGLGCRHALLLDGGISGQLMVRKADGSVRSWPGTRSVPLGLVGTPRGSR
ncbi:MAG: phosphodiester glycosidase family protein [Gemmatimonadales bacterium]